MTDDLHPWEDAVSSAAEDDIYDAAPPPLEQIIARARALADQPEELVAVAEAFAAQPDDADGLEVYIESARACAELDLASPPQPAAFVDETADIDVVDVVDVRTVPEKPHPPGRLDELKDQPWTRRLVPLVATLLAAAAVLTAFFVQRGARIDPAREWPAADQAVAQLPPGSIGAVEPPENSVENSSPPLPTTQTDVPAPESEPPLSLGPGAPTERPPVGANRVQRLRGLDDEAQSALQRGDTKAAERTLRQMIAVGGNSKLVELAYGDLFTIAHQRGIIAGRKDLWRAYLESFPNGRFADDARAGLCRHATDQTARRCWQSYLSAFPSGAYRESAQEALGRLPQRSSSN